jgi:hypothetical protein
VEAPGGTTVQALEGSNNLAVVRVDEVLMGKGLAQKLAGQKVTLGLTQGPVSAGDEAYFTAASWIVSDGIALHEVSRTPVDVGEDTVREVVDRNAELEMMKRIADAELIVTARIARIATPDLRRKRPIVTEHDPQWRVMYLEVDGTLKGEQTDAPVPVWYASSMDVQWFKAPKPKVGERRLFLLRNRALVGVDRAQLAVLDPRDVMDADEAKRVGDLLDRMR